MPRLKTFIRACLLTLVWCAFPAQAQERFITLASTTSTEESGLFGHLIPIFRAATGIDVRVVAVGTGQALAIGSHGDADALLVHDRIGEDKFIADGNGIDRRDVMYNDFVIVGPRTDPAGINGLKDARQAFAKIAQALAAFASRGDDSGTNRMELRLWKALGLAPHDAPWYRELGSGMGATLNTAVADERLCADRPRHLGAFPEPRQSRDSGRRRQASPQSLWQHPGQSREIAR